MGTTSWGPWRHLRGQRYLGLKFVVKGRTHYGWARVKIERLPFYILTGYAYETVPGKGIITGRTQGPEDVQQSNATPVMPTPDPPTLGILAMGAPGLSIWRRKESVAPGD